MSRHAANTFALPNDFQDDLARRCFPHRFRKIGDPFSYLDAIGIGPIIEFISRGHLLIEVAEETDVPITILRRWVEHRDHFDDIAIAETESAEGMLAQARRMVREAATQFELSKASKMLGHAESMATKKNKPLYGELKRDAEGKATVSYVFNINGQASQPLAQNIAATVVAVQERVEFNPLDLLIAPESLMPPLPESIDGELMLVAERPANPTARDPDIGPFYEEVTAYE